MKDSSVCPSLDELKAFSLGRLAEDDLSRVERHLVDCAACLEALAKTRVVDSLVDAALEGRDADLSRDAPRQPTPLPDESGAQPNDSGDYSFSSTQIPANERPPGFQAIKPDEAAVTKALQQFIKELEETGIVPREILRDYLPPKTTTRNRDQLCAELIRNKLLTDFQVERISQGQGRSLIFGNCLLQEKIGTGGMGEVYRAIHRKMNRTVAIKLLKTHSASNPMMIARFQREVEATAKFSHPNVVVAYDAAVDNGVQYLVMELVNGVDLSATIKKHGPLPVEAAVHFILQAARGLAAAHSEGIVHRDIKPANLLLDRQRQAVKILDWGLASMRGGLDPIVEIDLTSTGDIMGTVDFMAPEQAMDAKSADGRADIYSLGCSIYFLLLAKPMYEGDTLMKKLIAHRDQPVPSLRASKTEIPESLDLVYQKMVSKSVEGRHQQMSQVIADLEQIAFSLKPATPLDTEVDWDGKYPLKRRSITNLVVTDLHGTTARPEPAAPRVLARIGGWPGMTGFLLLTVWLIYWFMPHTPRAPLWWPADLEQLGFKPSSDSRRVQIRDQTYETQLQRIVAGKTVLFQLVPEFEIPKKDRTVKTFYVMEQPVTNAMFNEFVKSNPDFKVVQREEAPWTANDDLPVTNVHPLEAEHFAQWFAPNLATVPTKTQWDVAAGYYEFATRLSDKDRSKVPAEIILEGSNPYTTAKFKLGPGPGMGEFQPSGKQQPLKNRSPYGCLYPYDFDHTEIKLSAFDEITSSVQDVKQGVTDLREWTMEGGAADLTSLYSWAKCQSRRVLKGEQRFRWIVPEGEDGEGACPLVEKLDVMSGVLYLKPEPGNHMFDRNTGFRIVLLTKKLSG